MTEVASRTRPDATARKTPGTPADKTRLAALIEALRCRLCRRIAGIVFLSILAVEAAVLVPSYNNAHDDLHSRLVQAGSAALSGAYGRETHADVGVLLDRETLPLPGPVVGIAVYREGNMIRRFGEKPSADLASLPAAGRQRDGGQRVEVYYPPARLDAEVGILARLDSSNVAPALTAFVWRIAGLALIISAVVCAVTMLVVARMSMAPMLSLREILLAAREAPREADRLHFGWSRHEWGDLGEALDRLLERVARTYREDLAMMTMMAEDASDAILAYDTNGKLLYANAAARRLTGCEDRAEMQRLGLPRIRFPDSQTAQPLSMAAVPGMTSRRVTVETRAGEQIPCLIAVPRLNLDATTSVQCYVHLTDISPLQAAQDRLQEQNMELATANRAKSELLANVSHELRTPLNAIMGFAEVLRDHAFGNDTQSPYREYAEDIRLSGAHLLSLINDILDLSQIEAGRFPQRESVVDVGAAIQATTRVVRGRIEARTLTLKVEVPEDLPGLVADERSIKQILINLQSNAVKFTPAGGEVVTAARQRPDGVLELTVRDTGPGMDAETVAGAFQAFKRGKEALHREGTGAGLGLPLVKALVEMHNGTVVIDSKPGAGTCVHVAFPAERTAPAPRRREDAPEA